MSAKYSIISTEDVNAKNDDYYPSVKSKDANERKMARQLRIEKRVAAVKLQTQRETGIYIEEKKEPVEIQMEKSAGILDNLLKESQEYLENVRVANEAREFDRKESEGIGRGMVISRLEAEAAEAQKLFSEIAGKWSSIQDYKDPLHIHEDILLQKMKCDELIKEKDDLIEMLKGEVRMAERKFTSDQVKQNQDIAILGSRIEKQIDFIKKAYATEFNLIDQVISEEKRKFIEKSNEKWEDLYRKRNQEESALTEYKLQKQEEISSKIRHLNVCHEEQFRKTKIELERDIEKAQNEFERIKSLALFNRERLEYNYEVLKRRENENLIIKSQQKRRMSKLQDTISDLKTTLSDYRKTTTKKIKKTKSDIEKLRKNIVDIDDKADQFANSSEKKFKDLWKLNARDCYNLLDKIIKIDRILHEQQLGVRWTRPVYQKIDFPSIGDRQSVSSVGPKQKSSLLLKKSKSDTRSTSALNLSKSYHTESDTYKKLLKRVLKALDKKSGFLTEKCIKLLINTYEDDEQSLVTLDNVFLSLGIKKSQDIDVMADFFLPYCYCRVCAEHYSSHSSFASTAIASRHMSQVSYMSKTSFQRSNYFSPSIIEVEYTLEGIQQSDDLISHIVKEVIEKESLVDEHGLLKIDTPDEDSEDDEQCYTHPKERLSGRRRTLKVDIEKISCKYNHPLVISTVYVLAALKEFVIKYHKQQQTTQIGPTMEERLSKRRCTASRSLEDEDIKRHWINLRRTFRKSHMLIWDGLREGLTKYLEILKDRKNVSEDVMKLRKTNEALKRLLADYIDHRVLMKPICPQKSSELLRKCSQTTQIKI
ncbi:dynein regulatory complex protein 1-like isoform X5 [Diorhabda carinulata]|uniref:dynein regulatory complex protein 1-like isoform X5 n=1 Tax=Diorhabda carinulata TaxID=1163345 RepID=UPI0025A1DAE0|nr:dynein regulatory complex protein 1-like isoform X5 [Diorhabda carinulata]